VTNLVAWNSSNKSAATIGATGQIRGVGAGTITIQATQGSVSGSTGLTVSAGALQSIVVLPGNQAIAVGGAQQYTATGIYSNGMVQDVSSLVTWSSSNTSMATISTSGLANGIAKGASTITAAFGAVSGSTALTITGTGATLQSISISPSPVSLLPNESQQMTATGTYSDGSTQDVTNWATWSSSNIAVATISGAGDHRRFLRIRGRQSTLPGWPGIQVPQLRRFDDGGRRGGFFDRRL
jgi:trimeric autotransporter adhesin